ncbi:MAG: lema family protein [Pseudacidovorax sp.]|uniref:lema family protein n=1 Tax=Pseudacidovorax sp. TaxID=1934311 RepID=UPI001B3E71A4|nr:lema family protein [Pseudacidovorax sp.]MBP6897304.1 lema family protein [Pseudacidovorax sp.]
MNGWASSLTSWGVIAIGVFWYVGAHNRLVRLRSTAVQAYAQLDAALMAQVQHVQALLAQAPASADEVQRGLDATLRGACGQLATSLGTARLRPLHAPTMAALATAVRAWAAAWHQHAQAAGQALPALLAGDLLAGTAWPLPPTHVEVAQAQFNAAVTQYNAAVRQFPAILVAWLARFKVAAPLV